MNILADFLLMKIVGDLSPLTANIDRLHRMGYVNNFELVGDQVMCLENRLCAPISDIVVDEVLEYTEEDGGLKKISLLAIYELKYGRKGIFLVDESDGPVLSWKEE